MKWRPVLIALALLSVSGGCVRRTMTINTAPQGAMVILNEDKIGTSPVSVDFTWYGDYDVTIQREGYETLQTHKRLNAPWYQVPPVDFLAEAFVPFTIHDKQEMSFTLEPAKEVNREKLLEDARAFRDRTLFENQAGKK